METQWQQKSCLNRSLILAVTIFFLEVLPFCRAIAIEEGVSPVSADENGLLGTAVPVNIEVLLRRSTHDGPHSMISTLHKKTIRSEGGPNSAQLRGDFTGDKSPFIVAVHEESRVIADSADEDRTTYTLTFIRSEDPEARIIGYSWFNGQVRVRSRAPLRIRDLQDIWMRVRVSRSGKIEIKFAGDAEYFEPPEGLAVLQLQYFWKEKGWFRRWREVNLDLGLAFEIPMKSNINPGSESSAATANSDSKPRAASSELRFQASLDRMLGQLQYGENLATGGDSLFCHQLH